MASARRIVVASGNQHKIGEVASILAASGIEDVELVPMAAFSLPEPVEDGETFEANALIKAHACARATGLPALADDSGIEVDALDGAPGVYSARYAGEPTDDAANNAQLLAALDEVSPAKRTARFVAVVALVWPDGSQVVERGVMEGRVIDEERGDHGFGYDPLFVADETVDGRTNGQLSAAEKDAISHRGRALRRLAKHPAVADLLGPQT